MVNKKFCLIFVVILTLFLLSNPILAEESPLSTAEQAKEAISKGTPWTYKGQTLEQILNNPDIEKEIKRLAFEKAALDKNLTIPLIDLAIAKNVINATERKFYEEDKGLYGIIKLNAKYYLGVSNNFVTDKFDWALGFSELQEDDLETKSLFLFSANYWAKYGWQYLLIGFAVVFWMFLFYPFATLVDYRDQKVSLYQTISFFGQFGFFNTMWVSKSYFFTFKKIIIFPFPKNWRLYIPPVYAVLMGFPILNRLLQIVTLEFLGVHWIWRTLIIAVLISFAPFYLKKYGEYKRRKFEFKKALETEASKEAMKIRLNN